VTGATGMDYDHKGRIGLALGGGGSKGSYQLGAWQAFREEGIRFSAIAGTSIGSVNGAFMALDDYDGACEMWENLRMDQCLAFLENRTVKSTDLISLKNAQLVLRELIAQRGLNTAPLRELLGRYIREEDVRKSPIRYGLMTALFPNLNAAPRWIGDIPSGRLIDYIMASAGFPGLQRVEIDGQRFLDGGFADNVPVSMLHDQGYSRIVAVDLGRHARLESPLLDNVSITYIHSRTDLGGTFDTTPAILARNRRLGYLDTRKAFGHLAGEHFAFWPDSWQTLVARFGTDNCRGFEQAAMAYDLDRGTVYTAEQFLDAIREQRKAAQLAYTSRRQALKIEHKIAAIRSGQLKVLRLLPPLKLAFLLEVTAKARQSGSKLSAPAHLFPNLNLAVQALCALDGTVDGHLLYNGTQHDPDQERIP